MKFIVKSPNQKENETLKTNGVELHIHTGGRIITLYDNNHETGYEVRKFKGRNTFYLKPIYRAKAYR